MTQATCEISSGRILVKIFVTYPPVSDAAIRPEVKFKILNIGVKYCSMPNLNFEISTKLMLHLPANHHGPWLCLADSKYCRILKYMPTGLKTLWAQHRSGQRPFTLPVTLKGTIAALAESARRSHSVTQTLGLSCTNRCGPLRRGPLALLLFLTRPTSFRRNVGAVEKANLREKGESSRMEGWGISRRKENVKKYWGGPRDEWHWQEKRETVSVRISWFQNGPNFFGSEINTFSEIFLHVHPFSDHLRFQ